jgi:cobalt-zinc-cadmium efflux system protein
VAHSYSHRTHDHDREDHGGHSHGVSQDADQRYLTIALGLLVGFMLVEVVVGIIASSLWP